MQTLLYFLLFAGLFLLMMRFGCGSHVMGHSHHGGGSSTVHRHQNTGGGALGWTPDTALDPVCGMKVNPRSTKWHSQYKEEQYYFCSQHCLNKFPRRLEVRAVTEALMHATR